MYNSEKDTYTCDTCGFEEKWDAHDDHRGDIWECEDCNTHFCTACFVKALGKIEWDRMLGEMSGVFCPSCYGKEQIRDYMIFEEETSQRYPFKKKYRHLFSEEIGRIADACKGCFDTEAIHQAIGAIIGFAEVAPEEAVRTWAEGGLLGLHQKVWQRGGGRIMVRGNVCVTGPYEGLYYIDNEHFHVYRRDDPISEEPETRLMGDLSYDELAGDEWLYDEWGTEEEESDILECFTSSFARMFPSFARPAKKAWIAEPGFGGRSRLVLLESKLFYICVEDNEWSLAMELLQKEDPFDDHLSGLQGRHYLKYLEGIKKCLLERLPSIGTYTGAWTSGRIKREECLT